MKKESITKAILTCLIAASPISAASAEACNPSIYKTVQKHLKADEFAPSKSGGTVIAEACKTWPYKPDMVIGAFVRNEGAEDEKQLSVLLIDTKRQRITNFFQRYISEDSLTQVGEQSLSIDTARYQLNDTTRAFGIRFQSIARGPSCGDTYWGSELTLFVPAGDGLIPVATLPVHAQRWLKGCPANTESAQWEDAALSIGIGSQQTNGFANLLLSAQISTNPSTRPANAHHPQMEKHVLRFDGHAYRKGENSPWWVPF